MLQKKNLLKKCVIASEIRGSQTVITNFSKEPDAYGKIKHTGRPKNISLALKEDGFGEKLGRDRANPQTV